MASKTAVQKIKEDGELKEFFARVMTEVYLVPEAESLAELIVTTYESGDNVNDVANVVRAAVGQGR